MLENYRALSKKRLGPFSGNWEKNTITKIIGFKVRFNYQVYQNMNQVTFNIEAQVHSRTSQTKYQIRSTVMMGCPQTIYPPVKSLEMDLNYKQRLCKIIFIGPCRFQQNANLH